MGIGLGNRKYEYKDEGVAMFCRKRRVNYFQGIRRAIIGTFCTRFFFAQEYGA